MERAGRDRKEGGGAEREREGERERGRGVRRAVNSISNMAYDGQQPSHLSPIR